MRTWPIEDASDLAWLAGVLWPNRDLVRPSTTPRAEVGWRRVTTFLVLPNLRRPRSLIPDRPAVGAALTVYNDAMEGWTRVRKALAGMVVDRSSGRRLIRGRLHLDVRRDIADADLDDLLLDRWIASTIGRADSSAAITFGARRPTRKPVLLLLSPAGQRIAYAKVGWNPTTAEMVRGEADTLRRLARHEARSFLAPKPLHEGTWRGLPVLVTAALPSPFRRGRGARAWPDPAVLLDVARSDGELRTAPLAEAPWWRDLGERLTQQGQPPELEPLLDLRDHLERSWGDALVPLGRWHGDWAPWNMAHLPDGRLALWDWERSRRGVPVGMDAAHRAFQIALRRTGMEGAPAFGQALEELTAYLQAADLDARTSQPLLGQYLIELALRFERARELGMLMPDDPGRRAVQAAVIEALGCLP